MLVEITMPKLSDTMEEGTILRWYKHAGDRIEAGEVLAEVETDKADMELEADKSGVVSEIRVKEGEVAAVGAVLAILGEGESTQPAPAPETKTSAGKSSAKPVPPPPVPKAKPAAPAPPRATPPQPSPEPARVAPPPSARWTPRPAAAPQSEQSSAPNGRHDVS